MSQRDPSGMSPGEHLRAEIERLGLDQVAVAEATDVSRQTINNIINGRQQISRAMATKLGRLTGRSSDYWLRASFPGDDGRDIGPVDPRGGDHALLDQRHGIRAVSILVNHQIVRLVRDRVIVVQPFNVGNVQPASIDLTLDDFIITNEGRTFDISGGQSFVLQGGETVNVRTRESLEFPIDYVGRIGAMTRMAKFGIIMSHGFQVDPGFSGHLQFCLFNAGGHAFELRSGEPIVSLEIMPLASAPSPDPRASAQIQASRDRGEVLSHFNEDDRSTFSDDDINRTIRGYLGAKVQIAPAGSEVAARIRPLGIEIFDHPKEKAIEGAVDSALGMLDDIRSSAKVETDLGDRYRSFFDQTANRLYLSAGQIRQALMSLGLMDGKAERPFVRLRDGTDAIVQMPRGSAKVSLENLAGQLHLDAADLILMLTNFRPYRSGPPRG